MGGALSPHKGGVGGFTDEWVDGKCQWGRSKLDIYGHIVGDKIEMPEA